MEEIKKMILLFLFKKSNGIHKKTSKQLKLLEQIFEFCKVVGYQINTQKLIYKEAASEMEVEQNTHRRQNGGKEACEETPGALSRQGRQSESTGRGA